MSKLCVISVEEYYGRLFFFGGAVHSENGHLLILGDVKVVLQADVKKATDPQGS